VEGMGWFSACFWLSPSVMAAPFQISMMSLSLKCGLS
jgi:hypothetical protein